jgi:hypothetical protein
MLDPPVGKTFDLVAALLARHVGCSRDQILHLELLSVVSL